MNKTELIDWVADKAEITKVAASRALDALLEGITSSLKNDDPVVLVNWGAFVVKQRAAREGRNPLTGEKIKINASKVVSFKAGKALKEAVKEAGKEDSKS
ncbi:MAG: HU family DNA-binding protein [Gammaproteobacteria bacterium]|nr:MAG: HU family DNA-binding protein [Gammaproteobacteria bacterium]